MNRSRTALALLLAGLLMVLGACAEDPKPKVAPSPSTSPTEPPSPSPKEPSNHPTGTQLETQSAFVRRYFVEVGRAISSGDPSAFLRMSSPRCANCQTLAHNVEQASLGKRRVEGGEWNVSRLRHGGSVSQARDEWMVDVRSEQARFFDGSGRLVKVAKPGTQKFAVLVTGGRGTLTLRDLRLRT